MALFLVCVNRGAARVYRRLAIEGCAFDHAARCAEHGSACYQMVREEVAGSTPHSAVVMLRPPAETDHGLLWLPSTAPKADYCNTDGY